MEQNPSLALAIEQIDATLGWKECTRRYLESTSKSPKLGMRTIRRDYLEEIMERTDIEIKFYPRVLEGFSYSKLVPPRR